VGSPAGSPVKATDVRLGGPLEWLEIHADGAEAPRRGRVWDLAPPLAGMAAWWVLPEHRFPRSLSAPGGALLVVRASRRAQVGRRAPGGAWRSHGGRYVDVGTLYVETDPASRQGQRLAEARSKAAALPPRAIKVRPLPVPIHHTLSGWYREHGVGVLAGEWQSGWR
jgi:hypothetical protein